MSELRSYYKKDVTPTFIGMVLFIAILAGLSSFLTGCGNEKTKVAKSSEVREYLADVTDGNSDGADKKADSHAIYDEVEKDTTDNMLDYDVIDFVVTQGDNHVYNGFKLQVPYPVDRFIDGMTPTWDMFDNKVQPDTAVNVKFEYVDDTALFATAVNPDEEVRTVRECVITDIDIFVDHDVTVEMFDGTLVVDSGTNMYSVKEVLGEPTDSNYMGEVRAYTYRFNNGYVDFLTDVDNVVYYILITSLENDYIDGTLSDTVSSLFDN